MLLEEADAAGEAAVKRRKEIEALFKEKARQGDFDGLREVELSLQEAGRTLLAANAARAEAWMEHARVKTAQVKAEMEKALEDLRNARTFEEKDRALVDFERQRKKLWEG